MFGSQLSEKKSLKIILLVLISSVLAYTTIDLALGSNSWIAIAIAFPTWIGIFSGKGRQAHNWGTEQLETSVGFYVGFTINIFILGALYFCGEMGSNLQKSFDKIIKISIIAINGKAIEDRV